MNNHCYIMNIKRLGEVIRNNIEEEGEPEYGFSLPNMLLDQTLEDMEVSRWNLFEKETCHVLEKVTGATMEDILCLDSAVPVRQIRYLYRPDFARIPIKVRQYLKLLEIYFRKRGSRIVRDIEPYKMTSSEERSLRGDDGNIFLPGENFMGYGSNCPGFMRGVEDVESVFYYEENGEVRVKLVTTVSERLFERVRRTLVYLWEDIIRIIEEGKQNEHYLFMPNYI